MRVQSLKKFSVAAASRFAVDMCGVGWAVPARSAEDNTVYQRCNDIGTRERKTDRKVEGRRPGPKHYKCYGFSARKASCGVAGGPEGAWCEQGSEMEQWGIMQEL